MTYKYYPMHMHLHASCDYGQSMALAMHNAASLGMNYIWFTDHDTRMNIRKKAITSFSFDGDDILKYDGEIPIGFNPVGESCDYKIDKNSKSVTLNLKAENKDGWQTSGIFFSSKGTLHTYALAGGVTLSVDLKNYTKSDDTRLIFAVKLSQRPPHLDNAYILYVMGDTEGLSGEYKQIIPIDYKTGIVTMPISEDASDREDIGGKDNAFDTIYIILQSRKGALNTATIGDFKIDREKSCEDLKKSLQKVADKVGEKYNVKPFVSYEISAAGEHKNCFCTDVPVIDYKNAVTEEEAIKGVKNYDGVFAINHPFATTKFKGKKDIPEADKQLMFKNLYKEFFINNALGANLMEVGFPEGRNFPFNYYLFLWDMLSLSGIFLGGYGASDCHRNNIGWFDDNNFAAFIGVDSKLSYPISEKEFTDAMKKRRIYTADPTVIKGDIFFETTDGHQMGSVISNKELSSLTINFLAKNTKPGWKFSLIENGGEIIKKEITKESFSYTSTLKSTSPINFQRVELRDENGRCILLTNPIYLVNPEFLKGE